MAKKFNFKEEPMVCPNCESDDIEETNHDYNFGSHFYSYTCNKCGFEWVEQYDFREWVEEEK